MICNLIFPKEMYFKSVVFACHFPPLFTNMTHSGIVAKEIDQKRENNQNYNVAYLFQRLIYV